MNKFNIGARFKTASLALASTLAMAAMPGVAQAAPSLADLITSGQSIVLGDKTFSDFQYEISGHFAGYTDAMDMAGDIFVHSEILSGNYGLDFVGTWGVVPDASATAQLSYTVTVTDPRYYLSDFHLDSDLTVSGTNAAGSAIVRETVSDISHTDIPMVGATDNPLLVQQVIPGSTIANDVAYTRAGLYPRFARIETTISLASFNGTTNVGLGHVQESFSQSAVPEPSSYAMVLSGLLAVGSLANRRRGPKNKA